MQQRRRGETDRRADQQPEAGGERREAALPVPPPARSVARPVSRNPTVDAMLATPKMAPTIAALVSSTSASRMGMDASSPTCSSARAGDRAARLGDAWLCGPVQSLPKVRECLATYRAACARHGTEPRWVLRRSAWIGTDRHELEDEFLPHFVESHLEHWRESAEDDAERELFVRLDAGEQIPAAGIVADRFIGGTPGEVIAEIRRYVTETGCDHLGVSFGVGSQDRPLDDARLEHDASARMIELFGSEVIPALAACTRERPLGLRRAGSRSTQRAGSTCRRTHVASSTSTYPEAAKPLRLCGHRPPPIPPLRTSLRAHVPDTRCPRLAEVPQYAGRGAVIPDPNLLAGVNASTPAWLATAALHESSRSSGGSRDLG